MAYGQDPYGRGQFPQQPPQAYWGQQPYAGPRQIETRVTLSGTETGFHWLMIICTGGLWWPLYAMRKRSRRVVTTFR